MDSDQSTAANQDIYEVPSWKIILRLLKFSWQFRKHCLQVLLLQLIMLAMGLSGLGLTGLGIDYLRFLFENTGVHPKWPFGLTPPSGMEPLTVVFSIALAIAGIALVRAWLNYTYSMAIARLIHAEIVAKLRAEIFEKLQRLSFRFFDANASGTIINRIIGDVQAVRMFIDGVLIQVFIMGMSLVIYLVYMVNIHVGLTFACLATTPLIWYVSAIFSRQVKPAYQKNRELMDDMVLEFSENIQGINVIKGFAMEKYRTEVFEAANDKVYEQRRTIFRKVSIFGPFIGFLTQINIIVLLAYGGYLVYTENFPIGSGIVVFAGLLQQFSGQVANIAGVTDSIQQSMTGARRVFEILDTPVEVSSPESAKKLDAVTGKIEFEHIHFHYQENDTVLEALTFEANPGEIIAIAGATGSGKSALMSLIPRFYDPQKGSIKLDGRDLRDLQLEELRRNIGLVFQENFLFSNTVSANISFGNPEATREQVEKAARIASAHDFIMNLEQGYDTILGESGVNLSGGQRQRLAIARAILLEPAILLLDDPTAAIDPETEHEILEAIENAIEGRTTFIVAHRLSTLKRADKILVLDRGRLVQTGKHEALMQEDGPYRESIDLQSVDAVSWRLLEHNRRKREKEGQS